MIFGCMQNFKRKFQKVYEYSSEYSNWPSSSEYFKVAIITLKDEEIFTFTTI